MNTNMGLDAGLDLDTSPEKLERQADSFLEMGFRGCAQVLKAAARKIRQLEAMVLSGETRVSPDTRRPTPKTAGALGGRTTLVLSANGDEKVGQAIERFAAQAGIVGVWEMPLREFDARLRGGR